MRISPPALTPVALTVAPVSVTVSPVTSTRPPALVPEALTEPDRAMAPPAVRLTAPADWPLVSLTSSDPVEATVTEPPPLADRMIDPDVPLTVCAWIDPDRLTAWRTALAATEALSMTRPPFAVIVPLLSTSGVPAASVASAGRTTCRKPSPVKSTVADVAAPMPTRPSGTVIVPLLETEVPSRTAKPPDVMLPWLTTLPAELAPENDSVPFMKSLSLTSRLEARKPPDALTDPVVPISTPLGLTRKT